MPWQLHASPSSCSMSVPKHDAACYIPFPSKRIDSKNLSNNWEMGDELGRIVEFLVLVIRVPACAFSIHSSLNFIKYSQDQFSLISEEADGLTMKDVGEGEAVWRKASIQEAQV